MLTGASLLQRLTVSVVDQLIADLKDCVESVRGKPLGKGSMVTLYGLSFGCESLSFTEPKQQASEVRLPLDLLWLERWLQFSSIRCTLRDQVITGYRVTIK